MNDVPLSAVGDVSLDRYLPYRLLVATSGITQYTTGIYAKRLGITIAEARVVTVVHAFGPLSTHEIADRTKMDKAKISRAIKQFTAKGVLSREANTEDKRLIKLTLTSKGELLRRRLAKIMLEIERKIFSDISVEEQQELVRILSRLNTG